MQFSYVHGKTAYYTPENGQTDSHHPKTLNDLQDLKQIPTENRGPEIKLDWLAVYTKTPSLLTNASDNLQNQIAREIETCEILRKNPHPNIATCYGCIETNGRVSGLCFKRYTVTLLETVNPRHLGEEAFLSSGRELVTEGMR